MDVNGKTKITGIFGHPIGHTLSPAMHNAAFKELGINMCYIPFDVMPADLPDAVLAIKSLNMTGVNITIPHKERVIELLDEVDKEAEFIGAVNTIVNSKGRLTGYNTDGRGFMRSLNEAGISVDGKDVFVIGSGGASKAISYYLSEKASRLSLFDIDRPKAERLVNDLKKIRDNVYLLDDTKKISDSHIVINATPLGMKTDDPLPMDPDIISSDVIVCDIIYKKTGLLRKAEKRGAKTLDGLGMLLWQGVLASELWICKEPPVDVMRKALMSGMNE